MEETPPPRPYRRRVIYPVCPGASLCWTPLGTYQKRTSWSLAEHENTEYTSAARLLRLQGSEAPVLGLPRPARVQLRVVSYPQRKDELPVGPPEPRIYDHLILMLRVQCAPPPHTTPHGCCPERRSLHLSVSRMLPER